jgi:outer membrane protein assembly factor BamB
MGGSAVDTLDVATGEGLTSASNFGETTQLLVDRGVIVISGVSHYDADIFAYSLSSGKLLWGKDFVMNQPVSANGRIVVHGSEGGAQYGRILDIVTGRVLFSDTWKPYDVLAASSDGSKLSVGWGHSLQVLDATTGKLSWMASYVYPKSVVLTPSRLYVATTKNTLIAVNLSNNSIAWTKTYPKALLRPIIAGGVLYVPVSGDRMYALNPVDGAALKSPAFTGTANPPVVTGAKVYVTNGVRMSVYGL